MNERQLVWAKSGGLCWYCGITLPERGWHIDHLVPIERGAYDKSSNRGHLYKIDNLVPSCAPCNIFKSVYSLDGFRAKIETQKEQVRKYSSGFRIAERMGIIEVNDKPIIFWFEKQGIKYE